MRPSENADSLRRTYEKKRRFAPFHPTDIPLLTIAANGLTPLLTA
jgi:hypothetical protein